MENTLRNNRQRKSKFNIYELNLIVILTGYPIISFLPDLFNVDSRVVTIPFRAIALLLSLSTLFIGANSDVSYKKSIITRLLIIFYILYLLKIFFNLAFGPAINYAQSKEEYIFWSVGVCFIPMLSCLYIRKINFIRVAKKTIFVLFVILIISIFNNKELLKSTIDTRLNANSALNSISYGHLGTTLSLLAFCFLGLEKRKLIYILPFILGLYVMLISGSRSPIITLICCLAFMVIVRKNKLGIGVVIVLGVLIVNSFTLFIGFLNNINPILADRLTMLFTDKEQSERSILFKDAFDDFMQYPVTGKHFLLSHGLGVGYYPHNFIIEAFMALGVIGGSFFLYLIFRSLKMSFEFLKKNYSFSWTALLFVQYLILGLASGSLWGSQTFWVSMILLFSIYDKQLFLARRVGFNKSQQVLQQVS